MTVEFPPPSSLNVLVFPSLHGTLGRAEVEQMAALIIRALAVNGDTWRPIGLEEVIAVIEADIAANRGPWARLKTNPFYVPSLTELLRAGTTDGRFAEWFDKEGGLIQFTPAGIAKLTRTDKPGTLAC